MGYNPNLLLPRLFSLQCGQREKKELSPAHRKRVSPGKVTFSRIPKIKRWRWNKG
jgi:hypothetical protein